MSNKSYLSIYAKSFNWAGFFLPKKHIKNVQLYMIFVELLTILLMMMKNRIKEKKFKNLKMILIKKTLNNPIIKNMWDLIDEFNISLKIIQDLFDGIKSDIKEKLN